MSEANQRTEQWFMDRCGCFSGTRFADVLAKSKRDGKPLEARQKIIWTIASERIQGYQEQGASSYSMEWGTTNEPIARENYELRTGEFVDEVGFVKHPDYQFVGVSSDGLVNADGGIEIKAPKCPDIHLRRFILGVPEEYIPQIQGAMWVTGRAWWDFVSFDPNTNPKFRLLIIRVERDEAFIKNLEKEVLLAEIEVQDLIKQLMEKVGLT